MLYRCCITKRTNARSVLQFAGSMVAEDDAPPAVLPPSTPYTSSYSCATHQDYGRASATRHLHQHLLLKTQLHK